MEVNISNKLHVLTNKIYFVQGDKDASKITFKVNPEINGVSLTGLTWQIRIVNKDNDIFWQQDLTATEGATIDMEWTVPEEVTGKPTICNDTLCVILLGYNGDTLRSKLKVDGFAVLPDCDASTTMTPNYWDSLLAELQALKDQAEAAAEAAQEAAAALIAAGIDFRVLGYYATLEELQTAVTDPAIGDAYFVGDSPTYVYIWDGTEWQQGQSVEIDFTLFMTKAEFNPEGRTGQYQTAVEFDELQTQVNNMQIESGQTTIPNGTARYTKFPDGTLICYTVVQLSGLSFTAQGNVFSNGPIEMGAWAYPFVGIPVTTITAYTNGAQALWVGGGNISGGVGKPTLFRSTAGTNIIAVVYATAIGRWK